MAWKTYKQMMDKKRDLEVVQIYENIVIPLMCGSKVIHIRTDEESRLDGICRSLIAFNDELVVLHIHSDAETISIPLTDNEEDDNEEEEEPYFSVGPRDSNDVSSRSPHYQILEQFEASKIGGVLLFVDADKTLERDFQFVRRLKSFAMDINQNTQDDDDASRPPKCVFIHTVEADTPNSLSREIQFYDLPLPKDYTLRQSIDDACKQPELNCKMPKEEILQNWVRALRGLTTSEATRACKQALLVHNNQFSQEALSYLRQIKRDFIEQTGIMEFTEPTTTFSDIGGLDVLIKDLTLRRLEFEVNAKEAGIQSPKGSLLVGLPGTGKSLIAQSIAGGWSLPLLEFNMANILGSYVGQSEKRMREVLSVAESLAPCVLMVDEIDKALSGLGSSSGDSGVTRRIIGTFLTWLNDRKSDVYVIATANDLTEISNAMPEMLRKGRWDDIWWVELPGESSREQIIKIHLSRIPSERLENEVLEKVSELAKLNSGCTGAELAAAVNEANRKAFHDENRQMSYSDLESCINDIHPISSGIANIVHARKWMKENARLACSEATPETVKKSSVVLEVNTKKGFIDQNTSE